MKLTTTQERENRGNKNLVHWTALEDMVWDSDKCGFSDREQMLRRLNEFRTQNSMSDFFFREPEDGQSTDPDDAWTWGPKREDIDWTGFPVDEKGNIAYTGKNVWKITRTFSESKPRYSAGKAKRKSKKSSNPGLGAIR
jgi:hypothetical protein